MHAADVSFVLNRLTGPHPAWSGSRLIDASRIGMSGHSAGGAAALSAMLADARIDVGVDMDGTTRNQLADSGLSRPFLFLGTQATHSPGQDSSWDNDFSRLTGWRRWITVAGTVHNSFTDYDVLADEAGLDLGATMTGTRSIDRYPRGDHRGEVVTRRVPAGARVASTSGSGRSAVPSGGLRRSTGCEAPPTSPRCGPHGSLAALKAWAPPLRRP